MYRIAIAAISVYDFPMDRAWRGGVSFFLLICCAIALIGCSSFEPGRDSYRGPQAKGGILDLRSWDFGRRGALRLAGQWDFASGLLLDAEGASRFEGWQTRVVPDFWKKAEGGDRPGTGAGTYRLRVLLPEGAPPLAIRNYTGFNAFELEVDGEIVASAGRPALSRELAESAYKPAVSPVEARDGELDLLLRVSNYEYRGGGIWRSLSLGERGAMVADQQKAIYLSIAITVAIAALSLNSLIIFANRRKEKSYLFFAIFGFVIALRPLVTGEYALMRLFPGMPFNILIRLEYLTAMFAVPAAVAFFLSFFPNERTRTWAKVLILPFSPFVLFELFLPLYWLTWSIFVFYGVALSAIVASAVVVIARAAYRRVQGGWAMFFGGCSVALCGINDILYSSHLIDTGNLLPLSLALFVILQSFVLAKRFTTAFDKVEALSFELGASNGMLKEEILNATAMSSRLEQSLAEKEILLKEVHHRVKNSLQIVSSIVSLQANRSGDAAVEDMSRSIKERIRVISLANEKLYDVDSGDMIDLTGYARDILGLAISSYESDDCRVVGLVEGERVEAEAAVVIDFGLVLTELVANSLKHALLPKGGGRVVVSIRGGVGTCAFDVRDDGPGFPEDFDPDSARSLGFKIVASLLRRRNGSLFVSKGPEPTVTCSMELPAGKKTLIR
jgi:two-component sensor histidine kinase